MFKNCYVSFASFFVVVNSGRRLVMDLSLLAKESPFHSIGLNGTVLSISKNPSV